MFKTKLYSSEVFDQLTDFIMNNEDLDRSLKLRIHTWFSKVDFNQPEQFVTMCEQLHNYVSTGGQNLFLVQLVSSHPKMFDWFGKPLIGNEAVLDLLKKIPNEIIIPDEYIASDYLADIEEYITRMKPALTLVNLLGEEPEIDELRYIICSETPNPYNIHPDTIVHKKVEDKLWYIAGLGHEFGHILTWDLNQECRKRGLLSSPVTRMYPEMLAHLCNKLLLDYYGFAVSDLVPEFKEWYEFGFAPTHSGMELYKKLLDTVNLDNAKNLEEISFELLEQY